MTEQFAERQTPGMEVSPSKQAQFSTEPAARRACAASSKAVLGYKASSVLTMSTVSKAGIGIIKMATSHWRRQEKKARAARSSGDLIPCKKSALVQQSSAKPQNCRRIVVLGAPRVGKTSILRRFLRDGFQELYEPTCEDFHRKLYHIRGETYQIDILDPSGERGFPAKRRLSILTGDIFLLVFSVDDGSSFEEVCALRQEIMAAKSKLHKPKDTARIPVVICANKMDLEPEHKVVSWTEVCRTFGEDCALFETSAKTNTNLEDVFEALARRGGLPTETGPSQHRKISIRSYQALRTGRPGLRGGRPHSFDAPYGALHPLARRPSYTTDLRQVLGHGTSTKSSKRADKCQIQ